MEVSQRQAPLVGKGCHSTAHVHSEELWRRAFRKSRQRGHCIIYDVGLADGDVYLFELWKAKGMRNRRAAESDIPLHPAKLR